MHNVKRPILVIYSDCVRCGDPKETLVRAVYSSEPDRHNREIVNQEIRSKKGIKEPH